jgi:nicotinate phosphoribosyltransferase
MRDGRRTDEGRDDLAAARRRAREEIARLPAAIRGLTAADPPYPVEISPALARSRDEVERRVTRETARSGAESDSR